MPRLTPVHYRTLLKVFQEYGCQYRGKEGSHHVLRFPGAKRAVVIPEYSEIDVEIHQEQHADGRHDPRAML